MKQTNNDNYDLNSTSPKGQIGFEPFRTDKHYYFHFNNSDGDCILFSQAYKSKKGADNGMESIKKNIRYKDHVLLHHSDDLHYFTIKAGNNQEVARSRNFDTFEDMEEGLHFLYNQLGCTYESQYSNHKEDHQLATIIAENERLSIELQEKSQIETELREKLWELETALAETTSSLNESLLKQDGWRKEKSILEEKLVLLTKKMSDLDHSHSTEKNEIEEFQGSTYGFRIDFYNIDTAEDVKVTIYQPLSREKKVMKGLQKDAIFEFITNRLPSTILEETIEEEFDKIAVKTVAQNSSRTISRSATATVATKSVPVIQETIEPAELAVTVEEIIPQEAEIEVLEASMVEEPTNIETKKVRNIYQMKAMVEKIRKQMAKKDAIPKPVKRAVPPPPPNQAEVAIQKSAEEVAIIEQFFGSADEANLPPTEALEPTAYLTEGVEVPTVDEEEVEEQTILQFFPPTIEKESRAVGQVPNIPVDNRVDELSEDELAVIRRFFPSKSNEPRTTPLNLAEIQTLLDNATEENLEVSPEEMAIIKQFFPVKSVEKVAAKPRKTFKVPVPQPQIESNKAELETVAQFFGKKEKQVKAKVSSEVQEEMMTFKMQVSQPQKEISKAESDAVAQFFGKKQKRAVAKSSKEAQAEIVASILSNIKEDATMQPVDQALVKKFFGPKKKKVVAKSRTVNKPKNRPVGKEYQFNQRIEKATNTEDIALFNKWFGK